MKCALLFGLACAGVLAQTPADKCAIESRVLNAATGEAIKKAEVTVRLTDRPNQEGIVTSADSAGHYSIGSERNGFVTSGANTRGSTAAISSFACFRKE